MQKGMIVNTILILLGLIFIAILIGFFTRT